MLSAVFSLLLSCPVFPLRLDGQGGSFPRPLSAKDEQMYLERFAGGNLEARNILIERNLRLVAHIIKKYYTRTADTDDLISIGTIGLIKGISTYKPDKCARLATYASRCIENEILMYFRSMKKSAGDLSLSEAIDSDGDGGKLSLMDVISVDGDMLEDISAVETQAALRRYMDEELEPREREILALRYGLGGGGPMTQKEVAAICSISRSYVSRIEKKAIEKLRRRFEKDG